MEVQQGKMLTEDQTRIKHLEQALNGITKQYNDLYKSHELLHERYNYLLYKKK